MQRTCTGDGIVSSSGAVGGDRTIAIHNRSSVRTILIIPGTTVVFRCQGCMPRAILMVTAYSGTIYMPRTVSMSVILDRVEMTL